MSHETKSISVGFCPEHFEQGTHMCLVFRDEADRRKIVSRFVESGIAESERVPTHQPAPSSEVSGPEGLEFLENVEGESEGSASANSGE